MKALNSLMIALLFLAGCASQESPVVNKSPIIGSIEWPAPSSRRDVFEPMTMPAQPQTFIIMFYEVATNEPAWERVWAEYKHDLEEPEWNKSWIKTNSLSEIVDMLIAPAGTRKAYAFTVTNPQPVFARAAYDR